MAIDRRVFKSSAVCLLSLSFVRYAASSVGAQTSDLAAAYAFSETSGSTVADSSGNGNDATLSHVSAWSSAGRFGRGLNFDGVNNGLPLLYERRRARERRDVDISHLGVCHGPQRRVQPERDVGVAGG